MTECMALTMGRVVFVTVVDGSRFVVGDLFRMTLMSSKTLLVATSKRRLLVTNARSVFVLTMTPVVPRSVRVFVRTIRALFVEASSPLATSSNLPLLIMALCMLWAARILLFLTRSRSP